MTWLTDDTVLMMQKCTQIKWHCAQIQFKLPIRWAVWRHIRTKNTYFINFHLSLRHNKNEAKEQKIRRTNTCLVMIWFFSTVWQNDKQTKTRTQSHSHSKKSCWKIASICERIVHIHHCMGYKYKYKQMCIHMQRATKSSVACVQRIQVWIYMSPNQSHHILC